MEHAKRMVLVDEKMLEYQPMLQHFQTKQDLRTCRGNDRPNSRSNRLSVMR
jgi:hypothetical protein